MTEGGGEVPPREVPQDLQISSRRSRKVQALQPQKWSVSRKMKFSMVPRQCCLMARTLAWDSEDLNSSPSQPLGVFFHVDIVTFSSQH